MITEKEIIKILNKFSSDNLGQEFEPILKIKDSKKLDVFIYERFFKRLAKVIINEIKEKNNVRTK